MTYRLRNIAIAVALAVLAAMMTSFYVKQQKQDIQQGQVLTTVWVAKADIPAGTAGDDISGQLEQHEVAKSSVTPGAIVQPEDLAGKVSSEPIYAGEQVSLLRFATQERAGHPGQAVRQPARGPASWRREPAPRRDARRRRSTTST